MHAYFKYNTKKGIFKQGDIWTKTWVEWRKEPWQLWAKSTPGRGKGKHNSPGVEIETVWWPRRQQGREEQRAEERIGVVKTRRSLSTTEETTGTGGKKEAKRICAYF